MFKGLCQLVDFVLGVGCFLLLVALALAFGAGVMVGVFAV